MPIVPFAEWRPDMPALGQWAREALNVVPAEESDRPPNELYGCLVEAATFTQGEAEAQRYLQLYSASVAGLNERTQRITGSSVPVIRVRAGRTP